MSLEPIKRPSDGFGKLGRPIQVEANLFRIDFTGRPDAQYKHYTIDLTDSNGRSIPIALKKHVFLSLHHMFERGDEIGPVYDGDRAVYSHVELEPLEGQIEVESSKLPKAKEKFKYLLAPVENPNWQLRDLRPFLIGETREAPRALPALNVAARYLAAANCPSNSRAFFPVGAPNSLLDGGIELRRGYITHLRAGVPLIGQPGPPKNLFLAMDVTCATFLAAKPSDNPMGSLADLCCRILKIHVSQAIPRLSALSDMDRSKLRRILRRVKLDIVRGESDRGITKSINEITFSNSTNETFEHEGSTVSIQEFFEKHWGTRLKYPSLPNVATIGGSRRILYPMELCSIRAGQRYVLKLDGPQTVQALNFQTSRPSQRFEDLSLARNHIMDREHEKLMQAYGLRVSKEFIRLTARVMDPPDVRYKNFVAEVRGGSWNVARPAQQFCRSSKLNSWAVIVCTYNPIPQGSIDQFTRRLADKLAQLGIEVAQRPPPVVKVESSSLTNLRRAMESAGSSAFREFGSVPPQIFLCITDDKSPLYCAIKVEGDKYASRGVTTQCMVSKHVRELKDQYLSNLSLKINLKLGGLNHVLPRLRTLTRSTQDPTMIVGVDLTHNNSGGRAKPSIAALVGSMDATLLNYFAVVGAQPLLEPTEPEGRPRSQEPIQNFRALMLKLLQKWVENNPKFKCPKRLIIFRDGVSDGEFSQVLQTEFNAAQAAIEKISGDANLCKITYIVCAKNHRIRFRPDPAIEDRSGNAPAGTIVDQVIGDPFVFDFFLQSQGGLKGTSRPTRYIVLKDQTQFTVDELQQFVNEICSGFQRATRSVGVATPAYYADLVARRAKMWLGPELDDSATVASGSTVNQTAEDRLEDFSLYKKRLEEMMRKVECLTTQIWWT